MNKHFLFPLLIGLCCLCFHLPSKACGYDWIGDCSTEVFLKINGVSDSFNVAPCPLGFNLNGLSLGTVQTLSLINAKAITWESCQNNVTGVSLRYRIYEQGLSGGNWMSLNLMEDNVVFDGDYTTRYRSQATDISISSGLLVGHTYCLELYFQAEIDTIGDDQIPETSMFQNNGGLNYKLTFTYGGPDAPSLLIVPHPVNPSCFGSSNGSISVGVYGDLNGLFYHWSNLPLNFYQQNSLSAGNYGITVTNSAGDSATINVLLTSPPPLTNSFPKVQATGCYSTPGSATALASGGTPPYQYLWETGEQTPDAIFTVPGTWRLTITDDKGCNKVDSVLIGNGGQIKIMLDTTICSGETYHINGLDLSTPGFYSITIPGSAGCDTIVQLSLDVFSPENLLDFIPSSEEVTCSDPAIELCAEYANNASYTWRKDGIQIADSICLNIYEEGIYEIQVVRDGCSFSKTIDITEHLTPPELAINGTIQLSCNGPEPALLTAFTNAIQPQYQWKYDGQVISTSSTCNFTVIEFQGQDPVLPELIVHDAYGCVNNATQYNITLIPYEIITISYESIIPASGSTAADGSINGLVTGGVPPYSILWNSGDTTLSIQNLLPGSYCVSIQDVYDCESTACFSVPFSSGVKDLQTEIVQIWPNPVYVGETLSISGHGYFSGVETEIALYNQQGALITSEFHNEPGSRPFQLKIPGELNPGCYFLRLVNEASTCQFSIIIQN